MEYFLKGLFMGQEQHRATARVLDIVESLSEVQEGLTLTELAVALKAPKSSLFPIVHTLEQRKYIMCDAGSGKYRLGLRTYIIGASCTSQSGFEPLINIMNSVTESTQEKANSEFWKVVMFYMWQRKIRLRPFE